MAPVVVLLVFCLINLTNCNPPDGWGDPNNRTNWMIYPSDTNFQHIQYTSVVVGTKLDVNCTDGFHAVSSSQILPFFVITCAQNKKWIGSHGCEETGCGDPNKRTNWMMYPNETNFQHIQYTSTKVGTWLDVHCTDGFHVVSSSLLNQTFRIRCGPSGKWMGIRGCEETECGDPNNSTNWMMYPRDTNFQHIQFTSTNFGTILDVHCSDGYQAVSSLEFLPSFRIKCEQTGKWIGGYGCEGKDCGNPAVFLNGECIAATTTFSSTVHCSCQTGYHFTGNNSSINCQADGRWSKLNGSCSIIDCKIPLVDPHVIVNTSNGTTYLSTAVFSCIDGYKLVGGNSSKCMATSKWSPDVPICHIKDCGHPPGVLKGQCRAATTTFQSTVQCSCQTGYHFTGNNNNSIKCQADGRWSNLIGSCSIIDCGKPAVFLNGECRAATTTFQSTVHCSCQTGYHFTGNNNIIKCQAEGRWSQLNGNCSMIECGDPNTSTNWMMYPRDTNFQHIQSTSTNFGTILDVLCTDGYRAVSSLQFLPYFRIKCEQTGKWTGGYGCEGKDCGQPPGVLNGQCTAATTTFQSIVHCSCQTGYYFTGNNNNINCQADGRWSKLNGSCSIIDCRIPVVDPHVIVNTSNGTTYLSTAVFSCINGYTLVCGNTSKCMATSKWSPDVPICHIKDCGHPSVVLKGECRAATTTFQSTVQCTCETGYNFTGNNNSIKCQADGRWSQLNGNCLIIDCKIPLVDPSVILNTSNGTTYLSTATFSCIAGYTLVGKETSKCMETSKWIPDVPTCNIKDCGNLTYPNDSRVVFTNGTTYLSTAIVQCTEGYRIRNQPNNSITAEYIHCTSAGLWQISNGCELKDCGNLTYPKNSLVEVLNGTTYLSMTNVQCNEGYRLLKEHNNSINSETIKCTSNGRWEDFIGCEPKDCGSLTYPNDSTVEFPNGTAYTSIARVKCSEGYRIGNQSNNSMTAEFIECTSAGLWQVPNGCELKDCGNLTYPKNSLVEVLNGTTYLSTAKVQCNDGYSLMKEHHNSVTIETIKCTSDGRWEYSIGCEPKDLDECSFGGEFFCRHALNQTRVCVNIDGGYVCVCNKGFTGLSCDTDIVECDAITSCGHHAVCSNTYGGYSCACADGYPQGNLYLGCFKPVLLDFNAPGDKYNGDNIIIDAYHISKRLPYLGEYIHWFKPNMNGFVSLDFQPLYNQYGGENATEWKAAVQNHKVVAPLWTDIDSSNITNGGLWIHMLTDHHNDTVDIQKINDIFRQYTNQTEFNASVALVATWKHVTVHSPYEPGYELVKHQTLSMQCIIVSDDMYTYIMFNYDNEQFSIKPLPEVPVASGYTNLDNTGIILSNRYNFSLLNQGSNVQSGFAGRWIYNVTVITPSMRNEIQCQTFYEDNKVQLKASQLVYALPCPCQEVLMMEDYTFTRNDSLRPEFGSHLTCYESWFFSAYGIKQRCCYMFSKLQTEYPAAIAAEFENTTIASLLLDGYNQCCNPSGSQKYCPRYAEINPPDDCSRYTISDEVLAYRRSMNNVMETIAQNETLDLGFWGGLERSLKNVFGL
ncbi:sushi, von Willebrand factor type A, EGF and pentraxin domain-containing protein 1-like isoform X15 [Dreissena polymorpha]|uniref:sushi, von Willebrand factor type A, EGF and pentraxin domain-containing protein 1-like isoform X15 n=1 Tax=Dreissena polymorpha TaxID=45954 RepID=UPI002264F8EF|nr:sushi, von Willebrand factor type A, EGF and pentraxin domain-containing protein 1-like isoform X15 [Dreissena polymorpha]